ncbi:MAG: chromosomal replication initiator protein DnaA [Alphaproteobacteria bacterium]|nr:chromosomal replication initiator protein DnaA [Alphaproteobacteria bacterium]
MLEKAGASGLWTAVRERLRAEIAPNAFDFFIRPLAALNDHGDELVLGAPTAFLRQYVRDHFGPQIVRLAEDESGRSTRVSFVTATGAVAAGASAGNGAAPAAADAPQPLQPADSAIELAIGQPLNPRYTFAQFIAGRPNRFAHDAALGVAEQIPEARYNPLFLYGGSGLGKTHLMHALGHEVRRRRPDLKVVYLSSERFMNGFLRALREKSTIEFKDMLRAADVLLIDDIQFLAGKEFTQEEFFHALNDLIGAGKQLVLTADRSPRALDGISERIKSRLAGGLEADLHPTDFELRFSILQSRRDQAHGERIRHGVGDDVLRYLAQKIVSNVRDLEGAFNKLALMAEATDEPVTVERTREFLADILRTHDRKITVDEIMKRVADFYNLRPADMLSPRRARQVARPRQIAMYFAKRLTTRSLPDIGRRFGGRDHTTVIHAVKRIEELRSTDSALDDELIRLQRMLEE